MFIRACARAPWLPVVARVFVALIFVVSGFEKLQAFQQTVGFIGSITNETMAPLLTVLAIIFELGGGLMLLLRWKTEIALNMLVVFIILATILGHTDFSDPVKSHMNVIQILKNLTTLGGLLLLARLELGKERSESNA